MRISRITTFLFACQAIIANAQHAEKLREDLLLQVVEAIYISEGGENTAYPYGIKLQSYPHDVPRSQHARKVCVATVLKNHQRWIDSGMQGDFIDFLADRYCPPSVDPQGNKNWKKNVKFYLNKWSKK